MASQFSVPGLVTGDSGPASAGPGQGGLAANGGAPAGGPEQGAEFVPGATPESQGDPLAPSEQPLETESFEFAGQKFPSREAAEQEVRTALGRYKQAQREASQAQQRIAEAERVAREAAQLARAWQEHATSAQRQEKPQTQEAQEQEKPWYDSLDWDFVAEIAQEKGIQTALYWAMQQMDQRYTSLLDTRLKEALAPHEQRSQATQMYEQTMGTFNGVAYETDEGGNLLFPELHDQAQAADVVRIWSTLDKSIAMTPRGVRFAVLEYRYQNGQLRNGQNGALQGPAGANGASQGVMRGALQSARASSEVLSGNGTPRPAPHGTPGASSFKQLIGEAPSTVRIKDFDLGFIPS
jgi:hypothetical protein